MCGERALMRINVSQLLKEPVGSIRHYQANEIVDVAIEGNSSPVQGEVKLMRTDRSILVEGTLHTEVEITCSRCLGPFRCPLTLNIVEEYFPTVDVISGARLTVPDEPGSFIIDEQHTLDLSEAIRQYCLIAVPMKPLCREDCAGLCPSCGINLNQQQCHCPSQPIDPRWLELTKLVKEPKGME